MIITEMRSFVEDGAPIMEEGTDISGVRYGWQQRSGDGDQHPCSEPSVIADTLRLHLCVRVTAYETGHLLGAEHKGLRKEAEEPQGGLSGELGQALSGLALRERC
ncbi:diaminopimelate epimerase [Streptomyces lydicamycinicus]|uniref:Diaminopimelate epimerase n=1 Tax=Streptomyces lydicamycinicus TaxID=1546107 RepID=A0A0P4REB9_9ACTN|nr:diaminopimelate epimerase [Streptomyces lydicamycinicus]